MIGNDVIETILTPENTINKSVQKIDVITAKENYPDDTSKQLFDKTIDEDMHERMVMARDDGSQVPGKILEQIVEEKQTADPAVYLPHDVDQEYYTGQYLNGVQHEEQHCPAAQKHNDNIFLGSNNKLVKSNFDVFQVINEEGNTEKSKSAQISDFANKKGKNTHQLREVKDELSLYISESLHGYITADSVSICSALCGRPTGLFLTIFID